MIGFDNWYDSFVTEDMIHNFESRTYKHIKKVYKYCLLIDSLFPNRFPSLLSRGTNHDISKYSDKEKKPYILLTEKYKNNVKYPEFVNDIIDTAIKHHWCNNDHHLEFYALNKNRIINIGVMKDDAVAEMCADWLAMSDEYDNSVLDWVVKVKSEWYLSAYITGLIYDIIYKILKEGKRL